MNTGYVSRSMLSDTIALEVSHLSKSGAYDDISFRLHEGEILGIAGAMVLEELLS